MIVTEDAIKLLDYMKELLNEQGTTAYSADTVIGQGGAYPTVELRIKVLLPIEWQPIHRELKI